MKEISNSSLCVDNQKQFDAIMDCFFKEDKTIRSELNNCVWAIEDKDGKMDKFSSLYDNLIKKNRNLYVRQYAFAHNPKHDSFREFRYKRLALEADEAIERTKKGK
jgi:hypothetical protein